MLTGEIHAGNTAGMWSRTRDFILFLKERFAAGEPRLVLVVLVAFAGLLIIAWRAFSLQVLDHEKYSRHVDRVVHTTFGEKYWVRGLITDRTGTPVVVSAQLPSLYMDPLGFVGAATEPSLGAPCFMSPADFRRWQRSKGVALDRRSVCDRLFFEARRLVRKARTDRKAGERLASQVMPKVTVLAQALSMDPYRLMGRIMDFALKERRFMYIRRQVPDDIAAKVLANPEIRALGVHSILESARLYPFRDFASQILGFTDVDGRGIEGIERRFDTELHGKVVHTRVPRDTFSHLLFPDGVPTINFDGVGNVVLTIDARLQQKVEKILQEEVARYRANFGIAAIMDPKTGEILALANTPVFDPMKRGEVPPASRRNRAIVDAYELGSVVKPLTMVKALDLGLVKPGDRVRLDFRYLDRKKGKFWNLRDHKYENAVDIKLEDIIIYSSNKGIAKIAMLLGKRSLYSWFRTLGFGSPTGIEFPGESRGILHPLREWYTDQILATNAFGHGTSITVMQLLQAYTLFTNHGSMIRPHLVRYVVDDRGEVIECLSPASCGRKVPRRRVVRRQAAVSVVVDMMKRVVSEGTARNLREIRRLGYTVAGKTGTAYKVEEGGYSQYRKRNTFIGFVSPENPRLMGVVVLDEPKKFDSEDDRHQFDAGGSSAIVFERIMITALKYLGIPPDTSPVVRSSVRRGHKRRSGAPYIPPLPSPTRSVMPSLVGKTLGAALDELAQMDVQCEIHGTGVVVHQSPEPGGPLAGCVLELAPPEAEHETYGPAEQSVPRRTTDW